MCDYEICVETGVIGPIPGSSPRPGARARLVTKESVAAMATGFVRDVRRRGQLHHCTVKGLEESLAKSFGEPIERFRRWHKVVKEAVRLELTLGVN